VNRQLESVKVHGTVWVFAIATPKSKHTSDLEAFFYRFASSNQEEKSKIMLRRLLRSPGDFLQGFIRVHYSTFNTIRFSRVLHVVFIGPFHQK
jgi:hypothetical protein